MSKLEEAIKNMEKTQLTIMRPSLDLSAHDADESKYPLSVREYWPLRPVQKEFIEMVKNIVDHDEFVIGVPSGFVPIGPVVDYDAGQPRSMQDDLVGLGSEEATMGYDQVPVLIAEKPAYEHDPLKDFDFGRQPTELDVQEASKNPPKESEFVLAINAADFIESILRDRDTEELVDVSTEIFTNLSFVRRDWCEKDDRFLQILPYVVFYKIIDGEFQIFVYQRGKGVGEQRLAGNCSIGIGGHINPHDNLYPVFRYHQMSYGEQVVSPTGRLVCEGFWGTVLMNLLREVNEEVKMTKEGVPVHLKNILAGQMGHDFESGKRIDYMALQRYVHFNSMFFLDYTAGDVEKHHLALMMAYELPPDVEVHTNEDELVDVGFVKLSDLVEGKTPSPLENWTRVIVQSLDDTVSFMKNLEQTAGHAQTGKFINTAKIAQGIHPIDPDVLASISQVERWSHGTLAGIFSPAYRFYAANAFMKI